MRFILLLLTLVSFFSEPGSANSAYKFRSDDASCGGFPKLPVATFKGSCLGLVHSTGLKMPRKILELEPQRFLITDMGGWSPPNRGALWELDLRDGQRKLILRAQGLYTPHDIQWGPDGNVYVGELGRVAKYSKEELLGQSPVQGETVIKDLPSNLKEKNLHPLIKFVFGRSSQDFGDLYINIGAPSDACIKEAPHQCVTGENQGLIRHYKYNSASRNWSPQFSVLARGLRNSMGLVIHESGTFLQAENSRDFKDAGEPYDEINLIRAGRHYGWPYCYNFKATSPEWPKIDCTKNYEPPFLLQPPHSAPLEMLYYQGEMFPALKGHLLLSWHGYQATGSRIVSYPTDASGLPILRQDSAWAYNVWGPQGPQAQTANPKGGNLRAATYYELVSGWSKRDGVRPAGAPVGMTVASDGSILIVDDKNKTILILTRSELPPHQDEQTDLSLENERIQNGIGKMTETAELRNLFADLNQRVFQNTCAGCHGAIKGTESQALEFLVREKWVIPGSAKSPLLLRVKGADGLQKMPLGGSLTDADQKLIEKWILGARP